MKIYTIAALEKRLNNAGLETKRIRLSCADGERDGIAVQHNYTGPYPDRAARDAMQKARIIATNCGYIPESRGYYTATYIYKTAE